MAGPPPSPTQSQHKTKEARPRERQGPAPVPGVDPTSASSRAASQELNDYIESQKASNPQPAPDSLNQQLREAPVQTDLKAEPALNLEDDLGEKLAVAEQLIEGHQPEAQPPEADANAQAILEALDALTKAQRVALVTGKHGDDEASRAAIKRVRLMIGARLDAKLKTLNKRFNEARKAKGKRPHHIKRVGRSKAPKGRPGERDMASQAGIVAAKLAFRTTDFKEQMHDLLSARVQASGRRITSNRIKDEFFALPLKERLQHILKFSSLPGISRHHWNTDIDLEDPNTEHWERGDHPDRAPKYGELDRFLSENRATLGLTRVYTLNRHMNNEEHPSKGYTDEAWHVTDPSISRALLKIYMAEVDLQTDVIEPGAQAILDAYKGERKGEPKKPELMSAMGELDLMKYVTDVNPEVKP